MLLERAGIPAGDYNFTPALLEKVQNYAVSLDAGRKKIGRLTSKEKIAAQKEWADNTMTYIHKITEQFLRDNCAQSTVSSFNDKVRERIFDEYHLGEISCAFKIIKELVQEHDNNAYTLARNYIIKEILGINDPKNLPETDIEVVDGLAKLLVERVETKIMPKVKELAINIASRGFFSQYWHSAKSTGKLMADWVSVPFSEKSCDTMAEGIEPIAYMGVGKSATTLCPIAMDFCSVAWDISLSKGMALELIATLIGWLSFEATVLLASYGVGAGIQTVKKTADLGKTSRAILTTANAARVGASIGKLSIFPARGTRVLSYDKLMKSVNEKNGHDERKDN